MRIAVYIDADNVSTTLVSEALTNIRQVGDILVIKAFGNTRKKSNDWKDLMVRWGVNSSNLYSLTCSGKNAADMAICCDVILQIVKPQIEFDAVCIVSFDTDFYPLIQTVKCLGKKIIGLGNFNRSGALVHDLFDLTA